MEEFTDMDLSLDAITDEVVRNFGERFSIEATRVLNTGMYLPGDDHMVRLALTIALGLYMKNLIDGVYDNERVIN